MCEHKDITRIALCILHYGSQKMTARLHKELLQAEAPLREHILVLDNNAPEAYPGAWRRLSGNLYWAGAFDWALDELEAAGYTHVWFCNNDIEFVSAPPYMVRLAARLRWLERRGPVGIVSPAFVSNPYHRQMVHMPGKECTLVHYVDGIAPLVSIACVRALGGLDYEGNPYGYGVDVWLSYRAAQAGWQVVVDHSLLVRHRYHSTASLCEGFLSQAALAEDSYLSPRLGVGWRERLLQMQSVIKDI